MRKLFLISVILMLVHGCNKDGQYELLEIIHLNIADLFNSSHCFTIRTINADSGFLITDEATYASYADSMRYQNTNANIDCDTATLYDVDFNRYSLIGIETGPGACDSITRKIIVDEANMELLYTIDIKKSTVNCVLIGIVDLNLALITKIPDNYIVRFTVDEHY